MTGPAGEPELGHPDARWAGGDLMRAGGGGGSQVLAVLPAVIELEHLVLTDPTVNFQDVSDLSPGLELAQASLRLAVQELAGLNEARFPLGTQPRITSQDFAGLRDALC